MSNQEENKYANKNFAAYVRVSSLNQRDKWESIWWQITDITNYIRAITGNASFELSKDKIYEDAKSWADEDRRAYQRLIRDIKEIKDKENKIDIVICWRIDRISRNVKNLLWFIDILKVRKVWFLSVKETIDTTSDNWQFMITMLWALWEMEKNGIKMRTMLGKSEKSAKWYFVWWFAPFWYETIDDWKWKKLKIVEEQAKIVRMIFDLYVNKWQSVSKIVQLLDDAKYPTKLYLEKINQLKRFDELNEYKKERALKFPFNKWHWSVIKKILKNETYIWKYYYWRNKVEHEVIKNDETWEKILKVLVKKWRDEWIEMECPKILEDEDIFTKAQILLNENKKITTKTPHNFSKLLHCWLCWKKFVWYKRNKWKDKDILVVSYRCWWKNKVKTPKDMICHHSKEISELQIIDIIWHELDEIFQKPQVFLEKYLNTKKNNTNEIEKVEQDIKEKKDELTIKETNYGNFTLSSKDASVEEKDQKIFKAWAEKLKELIPKLEEEILLLEEQLEKLKNRDKL